MAAPRSSTGMFVPSLPLVLLAMLLTLLLLAGGASRPDVLGQVVVRGGAWTILVICVLFARPDVEVLKSAPGRILLAAVVVALLQLIPLPPDWWQTLVGRNRIPDPSILANPQPWRPWSINPGATINAAGSLVVPIVVLLLMSGVRDGERRWLPTILMVLIVLSLLLGLLQFSGAGLSNPFVNDTFGEVSGPFANRNHFALFLAIACVIAPVWAFSSPHWSYRLAPIALGIGVLSALTILASGSRAGIGLGGGAIALALLLARRDLRLTLRRQPRWVFPVVIAGVVGFIAIFLLLSVAADRAVSIDRLLATDTEQDMRSRGLRTVFAAIAAYFPLGAGFGGFDPVFRLHEPFNLLKPTYFNHVHNDFLEVVLDTGIVGLMLLATGLFWWILASVEAWRSGDHLSKLGSAVLLLVIAASLFDYPVRTPLILAVATIAAVWLSGRSTSCKAPALPRTTQHL